MKETFSLIALGYAKSIVKHCEHKQIIEAGAYGLYNLLILAGLRLHTIFCAATVTVSDYVSTFLMRHGQEICQTTLLPLY